MKIQEIVDYCLTKKGSYVDYPFGNESCCIKVCNRIFTIIFTLKNEDMITLRCDAETGLILRNNYDGIINRGYHCPKAQQPYFNSIKLDNSLITNEMYKEMIDLSYDYVISKLPKKIRNEFIN